MFRIFFFKNKLLFLLIIPLSFICSLANANSLEKTQRTSGVISEPIHVEPPFWWVGMRDPNLQLMLYGKNIQRFDVKSPSNDLQVTSVEQVSNSNYLFVNLKIDNRAKPGIYQLHLLEKNRISQTINYRIKERKGGSEQRKGFDSSDVIYLITPDRFANGNQDNDQASSLIEGLERQNPDGRHGGDIKGVINHLDYISGMGFTQIWLNPLVENNQAQYSYHGYSATDMYQIDARFGSNGLYKLLSEKAKQRGIGIIHDAVLNHIGSNHWWMKDLPSDDWINHDGNFVATTHKRESLQDPYAAKEDISAFTDGWFVPTMPDLNQRNQFLANYLIQNNIWWIEFADLSGIRIDTFSYSDKQFLENYTQRIMKEYPNFNLVGEEWSLNPNIIAYWQKDKSRHDQYDYWLKSLMDFPLQNALVDGLREKETWSDGWQKVYSALANDRAYQDPDSMVIFPDNHDMSRIFTQLNHDEKLTKMAMVFFATTRGIPQFFYGTEVLMDNPGTDSHGIIRSDFPGGWTNDRTSGFSSTGLTEAQNSMQEFMRKLLNWRKRTSVIHKGKLVHYAPGNGVYVYFRFDEQDKVMVILNKNQTAQEINPNDFHSMISNADKQKQGLDVMSGRRINLDTMIAVPAKTALIIEL